MSIIRDVIIYNENLFILCLPSVTIAAKKTDSFVFINRNSHNKIKCKRQRARRKKAPCPAYPQPRELCTVLQYDQFGYIFRPAKGVKGFFMKFMTVH